MRQQLAAMRRLKQGAATAEEKRKKVLSMREQMAQMSANNNMESTLIERR
jgi:hypothetical protein